jgi:hypothetical protein
MLRVLKTFANWKMENINCIYENHSWHMLATYYTYENMFACYEKIIKGDIINSDVNAAKRFNYHRSRVHFIGPHKKRISLSKLRTISNEQVILK